MSQKQKKLFASTLVDLFPLNSFPLKKIVTCREGKLFCRCLIYKCKSTSKGGFIQVKTACIVGISFHLAHFHPA